MSPVLSSALVARTGTYPVPRIGEIAVIANRTPIPFEIGALACFGTILGTSLPLEDGYLRDLLLNVGVDRTTTTEVVGSIDFILRFSMAMLALFGTVGGIGAVLASTAENNAMARVLDAAANQDAPCHLVPTPYQVRRITRDQDEGLQAVDIPLIASMWILSVVVPIMLIACFVMPDIAEERISTFAMGGLLAGTVWLYWRRKDGMRARYQRLKRTAGHWTTQDEQAAWNTARAHGESNSKGNGHHERHPWSAPVTCWRRSAVWRWDSSRRCSCFT
ncbi:hypothetical protein [Corynebacterium glyciniphilum]|uniref:hypothetical protein n=1 Tax=Corynebacterium glyciniphilum TaxID=1404244 RepID=UPI003FD105AD